MEGLDPAVLPQEAMAPGAEDMVEITMQVPAGQLAMANQVIQSIAASLQGAMQQTADGQEVAIEEEPQIGTGDGGQVSEADLLASLAQRGG